jgi:hypothetical protein
MTAADLLLEALKLDARTRAGIARSLLESLDEGSESEVDGLWAAEAERRDRAIDSSDLESIPAEQAFAMVRSGLP